MEKSTDHETKLAEVYDKLESGDCTVSEAIREASALNTQIAVSQARNAIEQHTQRVFQHRDAEAARSKFHEDHPDYEEVLSSGVLQPYIDKNPLLIDETLAYFQYKADQRFQEGKTETRPGTKEPAGANADKKYLDQNEIEVEQMRTIENMQDRRPRRREPVSEDEVLQSQLDRLKVIRGETS